MFALRVDAFGDLVLLDGELQTVSGPEEIAQGCRLTLGTRAGEWFLDPVHGLDFDAIIGKDVSGESYRDAIAAALLQEPRIQTVDEVTVVFDRAERTAKVHVTASAINGDIITIEGVETVVG
ncbi:hypothetical protein PA598K_01330 [Paenibacillus sp. 598K]|uniref:DUF2634 domain-containing protein n=1 Tax=Paenibacillus sp. 598K TaxID=1117987 RepID=UPI000FFACF7A|nr:DUF2634 domain-containing protein [Paenibacillus sp. 598K]GBF73045.1 hypothetical protein PA598K_01330 [Paenibacillus sp. 598K]